MRPFPRRIPRRLPRHDPRQLPRRLVRLYAGLLLYGASAALLLRAGLGLDPWDVFHQGVSEHTAISIGMVSIITGALVLLLWIPLRERPGLGTVSNVVLVGLSMDATLALVPTPGGLAARIPLMLFAVLLNGLATGLYISAAFGSGPRDGLMIGLSRRTGRSIRLVRTSIELVVLLTGILLGGTAGVGTVVYALAIGPLAQYFLRVLTIPDASAGMDFEVRRQRGILRPWSRRMDRDREPSSMDAG
ncbi:YitT family protein [Streptomyces sp. NBRC 109706]|uniref:membrane protein YczE n=1 Tax=Streptomyces sp. NBRC 109706 TaxID=1550035 RepID=UPI0008300046|nr:hypothetical protein [Streptomyces sp. NBRC 109706]